MTKVKLLAGATALVLALGTGFAVKAHSKAGSGNLYYINESNVCTLDLTCKLTTNSTDNCTEHSQYYQTNTGGTCGDIVSSSNTLVVSD